jgi:hypothetical protein
MNRLVLALCLVPSLAYAEPRRESLSFSDPELAFGGTTLVGGYVTSVLWAAESDGDQDVLYVPLVGPWLELFTLPDCANDDMFCSHGNATRGVLIVSGIAQLVGTGLVVHAVLDRDYEEKPIQLAPAIVKGGPGLSFRGKF